jgi:hypothetical protein
MDRREARSGAAISAFLPDLDGKSVKSLEKMAMILPWIVAKSHRALTCLATIGAELPAMKFLAMILILALLTMSGAAISDQFLTADQHVAQGAE